MADPTSRKTVRPIRPIVPGRPVDVTLGGLDPDMEYVYDRLAALEGDAAQIGTINFPTGGYSQNDVLVFLNGAWTAVQKSALLALNDLTDATIVSPVGGNFLIFDGASSQWKNQNFSTGNLALGQNFASTHRLFLLDTNHTGWFTGSSFAANSGSAGVNLAKIKTDSTHMNTVDFRSNTSACWDVGMAADTNNAFRGGDGNSDFVLGDHSGNAGAFSFPMRFSPEEAASNGTFTKVAFGKNLTSSPRTNLAFFTWEDGPVFLLDEPGATANYGLFSLGNGPWDGSTAGFFAGHASGTGYAANFASGYAGDMLHLAIAGVTSLKVAAGGTVTLKDAGNVVVGSTTGTKIGTATTQKVGFFNASPIVQPGNTTDLRVALINLGLLASGGATPLDLNGGNLTVNAATINADSTLADGVDITVGTTTGTKIGTATTEKLGFWNKAPVVQPAAYTVANHTTDRALDETADTLVQVANVLGTLILDLQGMGLIG